MNFVFVMFHSFCFVTVCIISSIFQILITARTSSTFLARAPSASAFSELIRELRAFGAHDRARRSAGEVGEGSAEDERQTVPLTSLRFSGQSTSCSLYFLLNARFAQRTFCSTHFLLNALGLPKFETNRGFGISKYDGTRRWFNEFDVTIFKYTAFA